MAAQTLGLGRSSPQALARLWPHAAPRASGIKMGTGWQTAVSPGDEVESTGGGFLPVVGYRRLGHLVDHDSGTFKGVTRELTLDRIAHVPKLRHHNLPETTHNSVRRADARLPSRRHHSTPFRPQDARFPLPTPRNWPPRKQDPPSRRYEGSANAANDSAIDGDG